MATAKRYNDEERQALVAKYNMEGRPPMTTWAKENNISYFTFKKFFDESEGTNTPKASSARSDKAGSLRDQFRATLLPENEDQRYIKWLEDEVASLKAQLAQFQDRQDDH
ncbi:hypothetical protein BJP27_23415 [Pseudomonas oryzihabitans]|nr:hypothetical protein BJP27_23415 [Pseudomonas psychrotolerans]